MKTTIALPDAPIMRGIKDAGGVVAILIATNQDSLRHSRARIRIGRSLRR